jgi:hypothetical protein
MCVPFESAKEEFALHTDARWRMGKMGILLRRCNPGCVGQCIRHGELRRRGLRRVWLWCGVQAYAKDSRRSSMNACTSAQKIEMEVRPSKGLPPQGSV